MNSVDVDVRVQVAIAAARAAGTIILGGDASTESHVQKSSATDIATNVDRRSERSIVEAIHARFPADGVLAEEGSSIDGRGPFTWIVDPLDGTANYVRSLRTSAVSIAIASDDVVVAGVVFDPYAGEMFVGVSGKGATVDGRLLSSSTVDRPDRAFVGLSGSNRPGVIERRSALLAALARLCDSVRDVGSTALSLCWTAAGRFDAHVGMDVEWWDFAAGVLIAREAGCVATGFADARDPQPDGFVVAGARLRAPLQAIVESVVSP